MAKATKKLTALGIKAALGKPGRHSDGDGLMLVVGAGGKASWLLRVQARGQRRDIGLGSFSTVGLTAARERAAAAKAAFENGADPVAAAKPAAAKAEIPTFSQAAKAAHEQHKGGWKNVKHRAQWLTSLETYAFPTIGERRVNDIDASHVLNVLRPIWLTKPETARRVYQRIQSVAGWAAVQHNFSPPNLAGLVTRKALQPQPRRDGHFAAMPYEEVPSFVARLTKEGNDIGKLALRFAILTAARSGEVRLATWAEIDLDTKTWTVPAARMKAGREHVVPLNAPAIEILTIVLGFRDKDSDVLFPGSRGKALSDMTLSKILRDRKIAATPHGFRSAFKDWASEETAFPDAVSEAALAHGDPDKVRAAYRRTDFLAKRRGLMDAWAAHVIGKAVAVDSDDEEEDLIG